MEVAQRHPGDYMSGMVLVSWYSTKRFSSFVVIVWQKPQLSTSRSTTSMHLVRLLLRLVIGKLWVSQDMQGVVAFWQASSQLAAAPYCSHDQYYLTRPRDCPWGPPERLYHPV